MKETVERYLQTIFYLTQQTIEVRSIDIGHVLGENRPDVFRALKVLRQSGYISQKPYGKIVLTAEGRARALELITVHRVITAIFTEKLGLEAADAEENAYRVEHILSDTALQKLIELHEKTNK